LTPTILVGRAIALSRVGHATSGDCISTYTYLRLTDAVPRLAKKYIAGFVCITRTVGMTVEFSHRAELVDAMAELLRPDIAYQVERIVCSVIRMAV
jgi:hypothetical protein